MTEHADFAAGKKGRGEWASEFREAFSSSFFTPPPLPPPAQLPPSLSVDKSAGGRAASDEAKGFFLNVKGEATAATA